MTLPTISILVMQGENFRRPMRSLGMAYALLAAMVLYAIPALLPLDLSTVAMAQEEKKENKSAPRQGKKSQAMSSKVADLVNEANELVNVENYTGAMAVLDKIKAMPKLSEYETIQLYSFYGYLYFNAEKYKQAISAYETVLKQPELPQGVLQQTLKTLAQLAFVVENYQAAIDYSNRYLKEVGPDAETYIIIGTAYYQMADTKKEPNKADYAKVIPPVEKAMALARESGVEVKENWLLLLRVAYWQQEEYAKVKDVLEQLVVGWPKKEYWTQLSGIYFELKDEPRQLAAYEAAYDQQLLTSNSELVQMAQLFMLADAPYKGARVLEKGLAAGQVERTVANLRLLSQAWQTAAEDRKAIQPLKEAAGMTDDGELYARLAQSYLNLSEYKDCIDASNQAIGKGGLKSTGNAYLILGMCQFEVKQLSSAKASFRKALNDEKVAKSASSWISFVEGEEERLRQLDESLKRVQAIKAEATASLAR